MLSHVPGVLLCAFDAPASRNGRDERQKRLRDWSLRWAEEPRLVLQGLLGSHDRLYRLCEVLPIAVKTPKGHKAHKAGSVKGRTVLVRLLVTEPLLLSEGRGVLCLDRPLRHVGSQACPAGYPETPNIPKA